jgi:hypothetical protein
MSRRNDPSVVLGRRNLSLGGASAAANALLDRMVGEAYAHVQGESLKAYAALLVRLSNSPITSRGNACSLLSV